MWYTQKEMDILPSNRLILLLLGVILFFSQPAIVHGAAVTDIRFWSAPDHTRVVLDLTDAVQYESATSGTPPELHLEIKGASLPSRKRELSVNDPFLQKVILTGVGKDRVKLVLYQKKRLEAQIFALKPDLDKPHRLVIDLVDPTMEKKEQEDRKKQKETRLKGNKIVVVDPGHGGDDPGAMGPRRTMEKDIVLQVGRKLTQLLNQDHEVKAFLTRKGDYFIPLEERVRISREYGADLFVSLHTDGSFNSQVRGTSVYCLSLSGATDETARVLADKENTSNILGGAFLRPTMTKDSNLNQILVDLMVNNSMKESVRFAELAIQEIKAINRLKYSAFRQANFIVLRAPDTPSALVEMAYITNKEDELLLNQDTFQQKMATTLAGTVSRFFKDGQ
jgi:N-acetylmuramoyl-L-alanine amidase